MTPPNDDDYRANNSPCNQDEVGLESNTKKTFLHIADNHQTVEKLKLTESQYNNIIENNEILIPIADIKKVMRKKPASIED